MRILLLTYRFRPDVGGIEAMSELLAEGFSERGHHVSVVTGTAGGGAAHEPVAGFTVVRRPSPLELLRLARSADVVFHNNPCLRWAWVSLVLRKRTVVAVRTWVRRSDGRRSARDRLKLRFISSSTAIANSRAVADDLSCPAVVIPNSYDSSVFRDRGSPRVRGSVVFVGRLVESKGADFLVAALAQLVGEMDVDLTIVGDGPERFRLEGLVQGDLEGRVHFMGEVRGEALGELLSSKDVMVVPSRWNEPFGIVALEGIASGCIVVASSGGGLRDAVGDAGILYDNGDLRGLVDALRTAVKDDATRARIRAAGVVHAERHVADVMVSRYLEVLTPEKPA